MLTAHRALAFAVIGVAVATVVLGLYVRLSSREPGPLAAHVITLAQTLLVAQVAVGLLLVSDERRAEDDLHYVYGTLSLAAVLAPWLYAPVEPGRRLLWFVVATFVAGALAVRAYTTA